ncbi:MAG TPA: aldo/keto reductase [Acidimicrobiia bacterium]|nr:aldo/keto reductase [Acidimicrobiia bacterium]
MERRRLGTSNLEVSRIGLGLAALGRPSYITLGHGEDLVGRTDPASLRSHAFEVLDRAWDAGICYFDVARSYGNAEDFVGGWLDRRGIAPDDAVVASKWGYRYVADWDRDARVHEVKDHTLAMLDTQFEESRSRLGAHLAAYQVHSVTAKSGVLADDAVLDRLTAIGEHGIVIGLTTSGPEQAWAIRKAIGIRRGGARLFQVVQATWNLFETSVGQALEEAADAGIGVVIKEVLANGRLTDRTPEARTHLGLVDEPWPIDAVAIAAAFRKPWVTTVLSGATTADQLASNLKAFEVPTALVDSLAPVTEDPQDYWERRSRLRWT